MGVTSEIVAILARLRSNHTNRLNLERGTTRMTNFSTKEEIGDWGWEVIFRNSWYSFACDTLDAVTIKEEGDLRHPEIKGMKNR